MVEKSTGEEEKVVVDTLKIEDAENKEEEPSMSVKQVLSRIFREVKDIKCLFCLGAFGGIVSGGCMGLWAQFFGEMIIILNSNHIKRDAWKILALFMSMGVSFGFFTYIQFYVFLRYASRVAAYLRVQYYKALMTMEASYFATESSGGLGANMSSQAKMIEVGLGNQFGMVFQSIGMIIGGFFFAFYESWLFTLILLSLTPIISIAGAIGGKIISNMSREGTDIYKDASARGQEILSGITTVQSLNAETGEVSRYKELISGAKHLTKTKAVKVGVAMGTLQFFSMGLFYGIGMYLGALQIADYVDSGGSRGFSSGEVLAAFFGVLIAGFGIGNLGTSAPDVVEGLTACGILYKTIDRTPVIRKPDGGKEPIKQKIRGNITFEGVTFSYPSRTDVQVLKNISMDIKSGQTVAFVGPSGCGKSTIISLLERFYDLKIGRILIDGTPIWNLDIDNLRTQIGYVGQEPVLFDGTIADNILLGTGGKYGREDVKKAAIQANAHNFIQQFPEGYDTMVGEGGGKLSGGQKQRISIARALVRDPQVLLLDEATSALDTESEKVVQEALDGILATGERTCCVIAHRLSTITNADMIFVFRDGEIVQMGSYKDLASDHTGVFHAMLKAQDVLGAGALNPTAMERQNTTGRSMHKQTSQRSAAGDMVRQNSNSRRSFRRVFG